MPDTTTPNYQYKKMDDDQQAYNELVTEHNENLAKLDAKLKALETQGNTNASNISLLEGTVTSTEANVSGLRVHKSANIVAISGRIIATKVMASGSFISLFTLPVGFRPVVEVFYYTPQINTKDTVLINILTTGIVRMFIYGPTALNVNHPVGVNIAYGSSN